MEQLSRQEVDRLVRRTKGLFAAKPVAMPLWAKRQSTGKESPEALAAHEAVATPAADASDASLPMMGLERRLARRAEALWESLRTGDALPPMACAAALLAPPFAASAMLIVAASPASGQATGTMQVEFVGQQLQKMASLALGIILPDRNPGAALAARLAAVAGSAIALGAPVSFDSDEARLERVFASASPLMMRAIALPLAACDGAGPAAVVITSWRELLSADETVALHRELAAAIDWMHTHKTDG